MSHPLPPVPKPGATPDPIVFLDITLGGEPLGRIKLHLFSSTHPKTCANFLALCTGSHKGVNGLPMGYKGSRIHRVVRGFILQGGDFLNVSTPSLLGTGSTSIYSGQMFADENIGYYRHERAGLLSMANSGKDTNGCQFFVTLGAAPHLDGKHVVFGQVVDDDGGESMNTVRKIEMVRCAGADGRGVGERPVQNVVVSMCGEM